MFGATHPSTPSSTHMQDASRLERLGSAGGQLLVTAPPAAAKASRPAAHIRDHALSPVCVPACFVLLISWTRQIWVRGIPADCSGGRGKRSQLEHAAHGAQSWP